MYILCRIKIHSMRETGWSQLPMRGIHFSVGSRDEISLKQGIVSRSRYTYDSVQLKLSRTLGVWAVSSEFRALM